MADFEFESRLDKMFAEPQAFDDAAPFASRVQAKLNRRWTTRRAVIGVLGGIGGLIGVGQIVGSGVLSRAGELNGGSFHLATDAVSRWTSAHIAGIGMPNGGGGAMWLAITAAGLGVAWAVTRLVEDL
jgi:hypothetical protein